jgi:two-component system chemotaxis sensor kinase CheA
VEIMDTNQYMGMFLEESREHLQNLNSCVLDLENAPDNLSVLSEIFRSAHTIKGMSATMGFTTIAELTHEMEISLICCVKASCKQLLILLILFLNVWIH